MAFQYAYLVITPAFNPFQQPAQDIWSVCKTSDGDDPTDPEWIYFKWGDTDTLDRDKAYNTTNPSCVFFYMERGFGFGTQNLGKYLQLNTPNKYPKAVGSKEWFRSSNDCINRVWQASDHIGGTVPIYTPPQADLLLAILAQPCTM